MGVGVRARKTLGTLPAETLSVFVPARGDVQATLPCPGSPPLLFSSTNLPSKTNPLSPLCERSLGNGLMGLGVLRFTEELS